MNNKEISKILGASKVCKSKNYFPFAPSVDEEMNKEIDKYYSTQKVEVEKIFINKKNSIKNRTIKKNKGLKK